MSPWFDIIKLCIIVLGIYMCLGTVCSFVRDMAALKKAKVVMKQENPED